MLLAGFAAGFADAARADETERPMSVVIEEIRAYEAYEPVWAAGRELSDSARPDLDRLRRSAAGDRDPAVRLASGYALLRLGEQRDGSRALEALLLEEKVSLQRRLDAASALGVEGGEYAAARLRSLLGDKDAPLSEVVQVELAKALWRLARSDLAARRLRLLAEEARSPRARDEAAIALASFAPTAEVATLLDDLAFAPGRAGAEARETLRNRAANALVEGGFDDLKPLLQKISEHPSLNMGREQLLLDVSGWSGVDRDETEDKFATTLSQELLDIVHANYATDLRDDEDETVRERKRLSVTELATDAAKSLAQSIGPFCNYLDESDLTEMSEQIGGEYGGIGAWVGMRNGRFTILLPMYNEPAFEAGIQAMDWVEKIDGEKIDGKTQNEIIKLLKGPPGTTVRLTIWRRGWNKAHDFTVKRKQINIPSVKSTMLPDNIGYIRIERFGHESATPVELRNALDELRKDGMKGLVLDLRNNPGGMLSTAVAVSDAFLEGGQLIVYSQGKPGVHDRKEYYSRDRRTEPDYPMVVLVNGSSASASEIVAGALKDHGRARLVGETTYGKGSVQQLFWLRTTRGRTSLKLTIAKYYLPSGRCIHGKGIEPDITVDPPELSMASFEARSKLIDSLIINDYIRETFPEHEDTFRELLAFDHEQPFLYPEFDALADRIAEEGIEISPQDIRHEIRRSLVTYLESVRGETIIVDMQENAELQRGIIELRKMLDEPAEEVPLYAWYAKKIEAREEEEAREREKMYPPPPEMDPAGRSEAGNTPAEEEGDEE